MKTVTVVTIVMSLLVGCSSNGPKKLATGDGDEKRFDVLTGADVLKRDNYKILDGRRVALVTNQTGRDREGTPLPKLLFEAKNVKLVKFLAPSTACTARRTRRSPTRRTKRPAFRC